MYAIKIDQAHAIVEFVLEGIVRMDEMQQFVRSLQQATLGLRGKEIKIKADLRALRPASPEVAEMIRNVQEFGIKSGVKRVAEIVESDVIALQLNRVARESGTDKILCRFWEEDSAREWLIHGGEPVIPRRAPPSSARPNPSFYASAVSCPPSSRGGRPSR
jgi:hypothetical protein